VNIREGRGAINLPEILYGCIPRVIALRPPKWKSSTWAIASVLCGRARFEWHEYAHGESLAAGKRSIDQERRNAKEFRRDCKRYYEEGEGPKPDRLTTYGTMRSKGEGAKAYKKAGKQGYKKNTSCRSPWTPSRSHYHR
jgi:hypothetical protein